MPWDFFIRMFTFYKTQESLNIERYGVMSERKNRQEMQYMKLDRNDQP